MPLTQEDIKRLQEGEGNPQNHRRYHLHRGRGHIGGSLSQTDILVALYYKCLNVDPKIRAGKTATGSSFPGARRPGVGGDTWARWGISTRPC